jgi:hypothetical protein
MRLIDFEPINVTLTNEEILADLVYPAGQEEGGR